MILNREPTEGASHGLFVPIRRSSIVIFHKAKHCHDARDVRDLVHVE